MPTGAEVGVVGSKFVFLAGSLQRERERGDIREIVGVWVWYLYTCRLHWLVSFLPFVLLSQTFQSHLSDCVGRERTIHQAFSINIHNSVICVNFGVWFC